MWFGFVFSFAHMHDAVIVPEFVQGGGKSFDVDGQGKGVLKIRNFLWSHMCIVPDHNNICRWKWTAFPVNCLNKDIKDNILKSILF